MIISITSNRRIISKDVEGGAPRMTETVMPNGGGGGDVGVGGGGGSSWGNGVEVANTIASKHHASGQDILSRKNKCVKFYIAIIFTWELTNRKEVLN
jgi:hypothetical protein